MIVKDKDMVDLSKYTSLIDIMMHFDSTDRLKTLEASDDAVTVNWGGDWHMPDYQQIDELLNTSNCTNAWVANYNGSGVNGRLFTSRKNYNTLFVPAAGYCRDGLVTTTGGYAYIWSRSLNSDGIHLAYLLYAGFYKGLQRDSSRYYGFSARGVYNS